MHRRLVSLVLLLGLLLALPARAAAKSDYSFSLDKEVVQVYWNADGTESLDYNLTFTCSPNGHTIDYVDMGMPNHHFDISTVSADVTADMETAYPVPVSTSDYQGSGAGFAVQMVMPIYAGESGSLHVSVGRISQVLYKDSSDPTTYASADFAPNYFGSSYVYGNTDLTVTFHLPPGVQPAEARFHTPGSNWPGNPSPQIGTDEQGRVTYTWQSNQAVGSASYLFGASFPNSYVPEGAIVVPPLIDLSAIGDWFHGINVWFGNNGWFWPVMCNVIPWAVIILAFVYAGIAGKKRKLEYLPPKISIEGHGIKRGLTAVEAAILLEAPLDKVMTMILFGVIKKNAATVTSRDPLKLQVSAPLPAELHEYEKGFLAAFAETQTIARRQLLEKMTVDLVKSVSDEMKGFSRKETVAYYQDIMNRAWQQIEAAGTPEVKGQLYAESVEWTMLDKDYDNRTRRVFMQPVIVPTWWGHYDPSYKSAASKSSGAPASLPGSAMAASVVTGVQVFSARVLGDVHTFTSGVTEKTNPTPISSSSSGGHSSGGGSHCACACACAGCACACAGGGR